MPLRTVHGRSVPAPERDENQDAFVVAPTRSGGIMLIVCDGMGGMGRGAEASRLATRELELGLGEGGDHDTIAEALVTTDRTLRRKLVDPGPGRPGCTAVVSLIHDDHCYVGWAGDARCVHIRGGEVLGHTTDHKLIEELVASGALSREDAASGRMGHVVTRCLGGRRSGEPGHAPETLASAWRLEPGDALVLCSDGLSDVLDDEAIARTVHNRSANDAVEELVAAATARGTQDDCTVVVYRHPVTPALAALPREGSTPRPDPLLDLDRTEENTWPGATGRRRRTPPGPDDPKADKKDEDGAIDMNMLYISGAFVCLVVAVLLTAAIMGGWL